jgi:hypothetical protein
MIEAIVIGRVGVDLTPAMSRTTLAAADEFVRAGRRVLPATSAPA